MPTIHLTIDTIVHILILHIPQLIIWVLGIIILIIAMTEKRNFFLEIAFPTKNSLKSTRRNIFLLFFQRDTLRFTLLIYVLKKSSLTLSENTCRRTKIYYILYIKIVLQKSGIFAIKISDENYNLCKHLQTQIRIFTVCKYSKSIFSDFFVDCKKRENTQRTH